MIRVLRPPGEAPKGGAQRTLLNGLQRFWKDLGGRLAGVPDTRRRLPAAVAELADSIWEKALEVAMEAAQGADAKLRAELAALRTDNDTRGHALAQREIEMESLVRSRERTIRKLEEHLRATMALVSKRDSTIRSLDARLTVALSETATYRRRLAALVARAVTQHRSRATASGRKTVGSPAGQSRKRLDHVVRRIRKAKASPAKKKPGGKSARRRK